MPLPILKKISFAAPSLTPSNARKTTPEPQHLSEVSAVDSLLSYSAARGTDGAVKKQPPGPSPRAPSQVKPQRLDPQGRKCNIAVLVQAEYGGVKQFLVIHNKFDEWGSPAGKVEEADTKKQPQRWGAIDCDSDDQLAFLQGGLRELQNKACLDLAPFTTIGGVVLSLLNRDAMGVPEIDKSFRTELMLADLGKVDSLPAVKAGTDARSAHWISAEDFITNVSEKEEMRKDGSKRVNRFLVVDGEKHIFRHVTWAAINQQLAH